jgi:hypothetical protein
VVVRLAEDMGTQALALLATVNVEWASVDQLAEAADSPRPVTHGPSSPPPTALVSP